jgi:hypothetical protein
MLKIFIACVNKCVWKRSISGWHWNRNRQISRCRRYASKQPKKNLISYSCT